MRIFDGIPSDAGDETIQGAVLALLERAQEQKLLSRKWSLAELQPDNDDFEWLCRWVSRLPEWLVGQGQTQAIHHLRDGPMKSDTFCTLWDALRNFRRNNIKAEQLKTVLARSPWILPQWIDE